MLRAQGVRSRYGVDIPYFDERGRLLGTKTRTRLVAKEGSYWEAGVQGRRDVAWHTQNAVKDKALQMPFGTPVFQRKASDEDAGACGSAPDDVGR